MAIVFDILLSILLVSFTVRSVARTVAYMSLAKDERNKRLKETLLKRG